MKIRIVLSDFAVGGAERVMLALASQFAKQHMVEFICLRDAGALRDELVQIIGFKALAPGHIKGWRLAVKAFIALRREYTADTAAVYISTGTGTNLLACAARIGLSNPPKLLLREACASKNSESKLLAWLKRRLYPLADGLIGVSDGVADELKALAGINQPVVSIANPVDWERIQALAKLPDERLAEFPRPYLLTVGRLVWQKNHRLLVDAFARIANQVPEHLVIIGEGPLRNALEQQIAQLGLQTRVHLLGELGNPHPWYARASAFALSSDSEGYPNALIEALAHNIKAIATDCDFGPRQILADGRYGQLVPVGNGASLAEAMKAAVIDDQTFESWNASVFSVQAIAARYLMQLQRLSA